MMQLSLGTKDLPNLFYSKELNRQRTFHSKGIEPSIIISFICNHFVYNEYTWLDTSVWKGGYVRERIEAG
jgi:hypothetical protein